MLALLVALSGIALVVMSFGLYVISVAADAPAIDELAPISAGENSIVYASDGSRLGYIRSDQARTPVSMKRIPQDLQDATVAIEDERFYEHDGVDFEGITRAAFENISAGEVKQGGSTITMQLVRNTYIEDPERDIERKIKEAKLAEELEDKLSKEEILEQYLNSASYGTVLGRTAVGVEAAAQVYFSKRAKDLDLGESAMIAGLPQSPSLYNPLLNSDAAEERRNEVLDSMADLDYVTELEAEEAKADAIKLDPSDRYTEIREPYFFDFVQAQLIEEYGVNTVRQGGLKVLTTIDPELQEAGRNAIENHLYYSTDPSAAVVSIDPSTGFVKAMASSGSYSDAEFNLAAQGHRQPGSAFKTFALTTAVRRGIDPDSTYYTSQPLDIDDPEYGHWDVQTYSDSYAGSVNLHQATLASDNTVYAQLALDLGPDSIAATAKDMGIETQLDGLPAETLGGLRLGVSPLEITNAYATLASGGVHNKPIAIRKVTFPDGKVDEIGDPDRNRVFEDGVALRGHADPRGQRRRRHRHRGEHVLRRRGRQDGDHRRLQRRDVRGLHPLPRHRRLGGLPRRPALDELGPRDQRRRGNLPRGDLARLHGGRARRPLRDLPRAREPGRMDLLQRRVQLRLRLELLERLDRDRFLRGRLRLLGRLQRQLRRGGHLRRQRRRLRTRRRAEARSEAGACAEAGTHDASACSPAPAHGRRHRPLAGAEPQ